MKCTENKEAPAFPQGVVDGRQGYDSLRPARSCSHWPRFTDNRKFFHSIQGEGVSQGTPCVFLRLAGCNLACSWCDTAYSWNGTVPGVRLAPEKAAELVLHYPCRRLVLTGGEPLIQQKALPALLRLLPDHAVEMETNGTIMPDTELLKRVTQFNVSPKLPHSGNNDVKTWKPDTLRCLAGTEKAWFKFVVACEDDVRGRSAAGFRSGHPSGTNSDHAPGLHTG